ncbi:MAG TPA: MBL fold metallo-hydrolase [Acidimicrobiia bacterium]|nr:MBL fold metallo-hydrolase [Acidimicrobiia bacterium]
MGDQEQHERQHEQQQPPRPMKQEQEPAGEDVTEVAPGVLRMQLPIKMPGLGHVNCYALVDDRGAALVDPGLPGPGTWKALERRLAKADLKMRHVHTVLVTHSHIDHFGTAARLAKDLDADFVAHRDFEVPWLGVHRHHGVDGTEAPDAKPDWNERTPWGGDPIRPPRSRRVAFWILRHVVPKGLVAPVPDRRVDGGEVLKLAGREWFTFHTPGHTLDHLCLHDPEGGVLLSGDHVLPTITPHISGVGAGPDPLRNFVESLDAVAGLDPVRTVLPAHGHPFEDLQARVDDIKAHHDGRLERLRKASAEIGKPATVAELSHHLFRPERWGPMAESEAFAHLEHLRLAGEAEQTTGPDGRLLYLVNP